MSANDVVLDTADEWVVGLSSEIHGVFLRSVAYGVELHVRTQPAGDHELTPRGLLVMLRDQQWASPPFDETTRVVGSLIVVAGTFEMQRDEVVREFFITDGRSLANAAMPGKRADVAAAAPGAERLVASLRFA